MRLFSFHFLLLLVLMLFHQSVSAQDLSVRTMELLPDDPTAMLEENQLLEKLNNKYAGIVKVYVALEGVEFYGAGVLKQKKEGMGEYWVWLADDGTKLTVRTPGYLPLEVNFRNYNVVVHSKKTYKQVLTLPSGGAQPVVDDGNSILLMTVEPSNASVTIDGKAMNLFNGQLSELVSRGSHRYEVSATGYVSQSGNVNVTDNMQPLNIRLEAKQSSLLVECATTGAQVYVNNQLHGPVPQTLSLFPGTYRVEVRHDGYRSRREDVRVGENEQKRLSVPALERLNGVLRVNYLPIGGDVYVDGSKLGSNPGTFRDITVGSHQVEVRHDGYTTASKTAVVKENEITNLSGSLTAVSTPAQHNQSSQGNSATVQESPGSSIETFTVNGVSFRMVRVEGGTFQMGATKEQESDAYDNEKPVHNETLSGYMIGDTEVTQELWKAVMGSNPSYFNGSKNPVERVTWNDCQNFIKKLSQLTGRHFRLPTEAEWEFAARGGNKSGHYKYSGSNAIDDVAWYYKNSSKMSHEIGQKRPNELGLYDMSGSVYEWCEDWYVDYSSSFRTNSTGPDKGSNRVIRSGSWSSNDKYCRVSIRFNMNPGYRSYDLGLRLAL